MGKVYCKQEGKPEVLLAEDLQPAVGVPLEENEGHMVFKADVALHNTDRATVSIYLGDLFRVSYEVKAGETKNADLLIGGNFQIRHERG